jgi:hypothetical protein
MKVIIAGSGASNDYRRSDMKEQTDRYTYRFNGRDGTFDLIEIISPDGKAIASLYYWDDPDTNEAASVERSARIVCRHLNRYWIGDEPVATDTVAGATGFTSF